MSGRWIVATITSWIIVGCLGDENVGCLFSSSLCDDLEEWCYDDYAFGHCLPSHGPLDRDEFYRFDLRYRELHALQREMTRLFNQGYRWSHTYTQCVMQELLEEIRLGLEEFDSDRCNRLVDQDLEAALKVIEGDEQQQLDQQRNLAFVKFTPSASNPHPEFADEVYFPPLSDEDLEVNVVEVEPGAALQGYYPYPAAAVAADAPGPIAKKSDHQSVFLGRLGAKRPQLFSANYNSPDAFRHGEETRDLPPEHTRPFSHEYNTPNNFREGYETRDDRPEDIRFSREYNTPEKFRQGHETRDDQVYQADGPGEQTEVAEKYARLYSDDEDDENEIPYVTMEEQSVPEDFRAQDINSRLSPEVRHMAEMLYQPEALEQEPSSGGKEKIGGGYMEGGVVFLPEQHSGRGHGPLEDQSDIRAALDDGLDALLDQYDALDWGFKRRERLDVKKPGPQFSTNNYAFQDHKEETGETQTKKNKTQRATPDGSESWSNLDAEATFKTPSEEVSPLKSPENQEQESDIPHILPQKKELRMPETTGDTSVSDQFDIVDTSYAYVTFKNSIRSWQEGTNIIAKVAELLGIEPSAFTNSRVDPNEVAFKVEANSKGLNASEVARRIEGIKDSLKSKIGVEVTSAGIGDKAKIPSVLISSPDSQHELYILTFLLCGIVAAVLVAATALFVIRRHARSREKLQNLSAPDTEASKDYQELCRARMANKAQQEKPEPIHVGQRIASLSRESEGSNNSPSSRSSTSSWSEEPALTNMDISTGHMVLSYMEDHLKNKDRLEQEWVALCAYEAEPCATMLAQKEENVKKNRYLEFLPYDHSRVVLNDLANISGSDYINASTITDHDPRNPAYIATQGPLPHTAPDFWQMVWEQGSVVMVMLSRLTEGGAAMCHRYWPEEGSELYHIYEVHLVSEHIWCDDYLVRSFYLKNLKTGETRTVTQFHFLSWPDGGVPLSIKALLEFRRKVNKSYRGRSCPIVVHCSDGVGRTGTYCLIDMVLNRMAKGAKEIDIAATLEHIRDQRQAMVRTKQQFEFVLMAVAEEVHAILKALPTQQQTPQQQPSQQPPQQPQQQ